MSLLIGSERGSLPALEAIGRHGQLALAFERRMERTVLTHRRFTLPLQVLEPMPLEADSSACLTLLNPTGGILGGDHLTSEVSLGPGTHVCLTTPSATKVYRSEGAPAVQELTFKLARDAVLEYVPDHVIPYPGAIYQQSVTVEMAKGSAVILFDAFATGRLARGERLAFTQLVNRMTVRVDGRPVFVDRLRCEPTVQALEGRALQPPVPPLRMVMPAEAPAIRAGAECRARGRSASVGPSATPADTSSATPAASFGFANEAKRAGVPASVGGMDGFGYLATLVLVADRNESWSQIATALRTQFQHVPSVVGGVSVLAHHGCFARFLAPSAPALTQTFQLLWSVCRDRLLGLPALNLRKY